MTGVILKGLKIAIPQKLRRENLVKIYIGHREMQKGPQSLILTWNKSAYVRDNENLFDWPGILTKADITIIDATPRFELSMGEDRSGSVCI